MVLLLTKMSRWWGILCVEREKDEVVLYVSLRCSGMEPGDGSWRVKYGDTQGSLSGLGASRCGAHWVHTAQ